MCDKVERQITIATKEDQADGNEIVCLFGQVVQRYLTEDRHFPAPKAIKQGLRIVIPP
jgi:hypothetical protein